MAAAVRAKVVFQPLGGGIMQASTPGSFDHKIIDSGPVKPLSFGIQEQGGQSLLIDSLPDGQPAPEDKGAFIIKEYGPVGPFSRGLQPDPIFD